LKTFANLRVYRLLVCKTVKGKTGEPYRIIILTEAIGGNEKTGERTVEEGYRGQPAGFQDQQEFPWGFPQRLTKWVYNHPQPVCL
jgi:hypothetical protein